MFFRLFANDKQQESENTVTHISTASKNSTKDVFVTGFPPRNITELLEVEHVIFVIYWCIVNFFDLGIVTNVVTHESNNWKLLIQGVSSVIIGTIIAIHEEEGWWYLGCKACKKKAVKSSDIIDLDDEKAIKPADGKDEWKCQKCNIVPVIKTL